MKGSQLTKIKLNVTEWPQPTTVTEVRSFLGLLAIIEGLFQTFLK